MADVLNPQASHNTGYITHGGRYECLLTSRLLFLHQLHSGNGKINFTSREREVLEELIKDCSNKDVAAKLNLSPRTVEVHRTSVLVKFSVDNLIQVIREYDKIAIRKTTW